MRKPCPLGAPEKKPGARAGQIQSRCHTTFQVGGTAVQGCPVCIVNVSNPHAHEFFYEATLKQPARGERHATSANTFSHLLR
jgi:hypothetical protein